MVPLFVLVHQRVLEPHATRFCVGHQIAVDGKESSLINLNARPLRGLDDHGLEVPLEHSSGRLR